MLRRPPRSTLFPTRRSSDLLVGRRTGRGGGPTYRRQGRPFGRVLREPVAVRRAVVPHRLDRKSTRLNSSHVSISYAVFCLKKKKKKKTTNTQTQKRKQKSRE